MERKTFLTTGEVAAHCEVSIKTVNNWIKTGDLKTSITPGRHHRVHIEDFRGFLRKHNLPPFKEEQPERRKILVVDDEKEVVQVLVKGFRKTNQYEVATASDGFEAGIQVTKFNPDLIILDLIMPNLDGFKVCQWIKSTPDTRHIKVLVLTGYVSEENTQRAIECGADYCMAKPCKMSALKKKVEALLAATQKILRRA